MSAPCCPTLSPPNSRVRVFKLRKPSFPLGLHTNLVDSLSKPPGYKWKFSCFRHEDSSSEFFKFDSAENKVPEESVSPEFNQSNTVNDDWLSKLRKATDALFGAHPWTLPWTKDHSAGNVPVDCLLLADGILDNFIPSSHIKVSERSP